MRNISAYLEIGSVTVNIFCHSTGDRRSQGQMDKPPCVCVCVCVCVCACVRVIQRCATSLWCILGNTNTHAYQLATDI